MEKIIFFHGAKRLLVGVGACAFGFCVFGASQADVIDVSPTGVATTYKGPTIFAGASTTPIVAAPAAAANTAGNVVAMASPDPRFPMTMHPVLVGYLNEAALRFSVDPALVQAVAWQESRFRSDLVSPKGAIGIMQLMPATARQLGVNPNDPRQNIYGGVAYLSMLITRFNGDRSLALAAYNAGPEAVAQYRGIPPFRETQNYVKSIGERISLR